MKILLAKGEVFSLWQLLTDYIKYGNKEDMVMKYAFFSLLGVFFFPFFAFALPVREVVVTEDFRSPRVIERGFTSAWYDAQGKRVVLSRDYAVSEIPPLLLDAFSCKPKELIQTFAVAGLERNIGCEVTPGGTLLFGFARDSASKNWVGRIYLLQGTAKRQISQDGFFSDKKRGNFFIGFKNANEFFLVYRAGSSSRFFEFQGGTWREIQNSELKAMRVSNDVRIAWSGRAWFFSPAGNNVFYYDGNILVDASGQIPRNLFIESLSTDLNGDGMIIFDSRAAWRIRDNGYKGSLSVESRRVKMKGKGKITEAVFTPSAEAPAGTSLQYFVSSTGGNKWHEVFPGQKTSISGSGDDLRWQVILGSSNANITPSLSSLGVSVSVKEGIKKTARSRDSVRARDIKKIAKLVGDYKNDTGHFPLIEDSHSRRENWKRLQKTLLESARVHRSLGYENNIKNRFPLAPEGEAEGFVYNYSVDSFGKNYLLSVSLESEGNRNLQKDWDGVLLDAHCGDPVYCVVGGPLFAQENTKTPQGNLIALAGDYRVYVIKGNMKRWISSAGVFEKRKFKWENIRNVSKQEFDRYKTGRPLKS